MEGLHLLLLSARSDWLVRRELRIVLQSRANAEQQYEVDIDLGQVIAGLPQLVEERMEADKPIWMPILRTPAVRPISVRVTEAFDGQNNGLPVMPQTQVRRRLAAGLAWLYLNGCYEVPTNNKSISEPTLSQITNLQRDVEQAIYNYLTTSRTEELFNGQKQSATAEHLDAALEGLEKLAETLRPRSLVKRDPRTRDEHGLPAQQQSFADCLEYARSSHLTVVGITSEDRTPRIRCDLLPAELEVVRHAPPAWPSKSLGLDLGDQQPQLSRWQRSVHCLERFVARATGLPMSYHFEFPVSEVTELDRTHISIHADPDVALTPSVLHHDYIASEGEGDTKRMDAQSYRLTSWVTILAKELEKLEPEDEWTPAAKVEALRTVAVDQLKVVDSALGGRIRRFQAAQDLVGRPEDLPVLKETSAAKNNLELLLKTLNSDTKPIPTNEAETALERLGKVANFLDESPHLELAADDDPRDHVAHFHVAETHSMGQRDRDRRPVIHGILRASEAAREGYMRSAELTCFVSTALLALVAVMTGVSRLANLAYSGDGLVTVLLLVPAVSTTLLARIAGDSMRFLVLGRMARLTIWSLVPPSLVAICFATFLGQDKDGDPTVALWVVLLVLLLGVSVSGLISWSAYANRRLHNRGFSYDTPVAGSIVYRKDHARGPEGAGDRYHSVVDMRSVVDLCSAALFQVDRPSRRFMVWLALDGDSPGDFARLVDALEDSPGRAVDDFVFDGNNEGVRSNLKRAGKSLASLFNNGGSADEGRAGRRRAPVTIESSAVQTVASTGAVMTVISGDRNILPQDRQQAEGVLAALVANQLEEKIKVDQLTFPTSHSDDADEPVVSEIVEDRSYFLYKIPRFADAVFLVDEDRRDDLADIITDIWGIDGRLFSISYLHSPVGCVRENDRESAVLKLGISFDREYAPVIAAVMLEFYAVAKKHNATFHAYNRRAYPDPDQAGASIAVTQGYVPVVAVSAGRGAKRMSIDILDEIRSPANGGRWLGGSILTAGGYACRTFRFEVEPKKAKQIPSYFVPKDMNGNPLGDDLAWRIKTLAGESGRRRQEAQNAASFVLWVRWRLRGDALGDLLEAVQEWADRVDELAPTGNSGLLISEGGLNLEYLNNRVDDLGMIDGKARYRVELSPEEDSLAVATTQSLPQSVEIVYRRSLYARLETTLRDRIDGEGFIVVSDAEPFRPTNSDERQSEFVPY